MTNNDSGQSQQQWFNDRRFTFNTRTPQRLRENVNQLLNDLNNQIVQDNPELLYQLSDQFQRLQDVLHGRRTSNVAVVNANVPNRATSVMTSIPVGQTNEATTSTTTPLNHDSPFGLAGQELPSVNRQRSDPHIVLNMESENEGSSSATPADVSTNSESIPPDVGEETSLERELSAVAANPEWQRLVEASRHPDIQKFLKIALFILPYFLIIFLKLVLVHLTGLVMFCVLVLVFLYAERVVYRQIAAKHNRSKLHLTWVSLVLSAVLFIFYSVFEYDSLYNALVFQLPVLPDSEYQPSSLFTVLWIVVCSDFAAKYFVLLTKCALVLLPSFVISFRRRSGFYQFVELSSHIYRLVLPIPVWISYLMAAPDDNYFHKIFALILTLCYGILKLIAFRTKYPFWVSSLKAIWRPITFGCSPKTTDLMQAGPHCSICYNDFASPVQLSCNHIFCEECISTWFDKERTCPICRTKIVESDRSWRDGSTSYAIQIC